MSFAPGLYRGDCRALLRQVAAQSFQAAITSPPYWTHRAYGCEPGELGAEETSALYIEALVGVFSEVRRVLRDDGVLWLNLGDAYNAYNANRGASKGLSGKRDSARLEGSKVPKGLTDPLLQNKALMGLPGRVADAMQRDGWLLRSEIVWHKRSPMPEPSKDRPSRDHELLFMFTKRPRYRYYKEAVPEAWRTVWNFSMRNNGPAHPARFPDELARRCLLLSCKAGDLALDPFAGSNTVGRIGAQHGIGVVSFDLNARLSTRVDNGGAAP